MPNDLDRRLNKWQADCKKAAKQLELLTGQKVDPRTLEGVVPLRAPKKLRTVVIAR